MIKLTTYSDITALIAAFDEDRETTLRMVYDTYRGGFIKYAQQYTSDREIIVDSYQEAVIALYENLSNNKISDQNASIKTYLYTIGKNKLFSALKKLKDRTDHEEKLSMTSTIYEVPEDQKEMLTAAFNALGEKCRKLLILFYYQRYSIEAIQVRMDYKNENTVKAHKSRCMSQLRKIIKNNH